MESSTWSNYSSLRVSFAAAVLALALVPGAGAAEAKKSLAAGTQAPSFQAQTTEGKTVSFPSDYKGKVVLLDFWATWCPPCRGEVPNVVAAYQQYHAKGFEVLGVSLDKPNAGSTLASFTQSHQMTWPQVYDGKYWKADVAVQYGIRFIPRPLLVDGDTGVIVAEGPAACSSALAPAVEKALAAKKK